MTDEAMSPLRRRMIEDMTIRKLAPKTQEGYIRTIKNFAVFLGRSPDMASPEDVRRFQLHLAQCGAHAPILNHTVSALRFFFGVTLGRHDIVEHTAFVPEPRTSGPTAGDRAPADRACRVSHHTRPSGGGIVEWQERPERWGRPPVGA